MADTRFLEIEHGSAHYREAVQLRSSHLREPLGMKICVEEQREEQSYRHFALLEGERVIATAMAVPLASDCMRIRQMVVAADRQSIGLGRRLLASVEDVLRAGGVSMLVLHAREPAIGFYRKCGYREEGELFQEVGIAHQRMVKSL